VLFTNFIAQFPTNVLAPAAQWWVADHFFRGGDWADSERNYKSIFQNANWQDSPLFWSAQMMAGRAALARLGYSDAIGYFTGLMGDTNCPAELRLPARFAYGSTLMLMNSADTNNPLANFQLATNANAFGKIAQDYPTNDWGAQAMIQIGNADLQMNDFDAATNAYAQVFSPATPVGVFANIGARSQAQIGFGITQQKRADLAAGASQKALLEEALDNYLVVFNSLNLRGDEQPDLFWLKKAGLQAAPLVGLLNDPKAQRRFYERLKQKLPQLAESLDKKIAALPPVKN